MVTEDGTQGWEQECGNCGGHVEEGCCVKGCFDDDKPMPDIANMSLDEIKEKIGQEWDYEHLKPRWGTDIPDCHGVMLRHKRLIMGKLFKRHTELEAARAAYRWLEE